MTTEMITQASTPLESRSRFAGLDVCEAAGLSVAPGGLRPRVGDPVWDLRDVEGLPAHLRPCHRRFTFTKIRNPRWRVVAQEYVLARLAPDLVEVRELPQAFRYPLQVVTARSRLEFVAKWFNWLTSRGITSLAEVDQQVCLGYFEHIRHVRDKKGNILRPTLPPTRMASVQVVQEPSFYSDLFSTDHFADGFVPWSGRVPFEVAGCKHKAANSVQPLRPEALQPWLAACLFIVETLGPHTLAMVEQVRAESARQVETSQEPGPAVLPRVVEDLIAQGQPLVELDHLAVGKRLRDGWDEQDPLLRLNMNAIARRAGKGSFARGWLSVMRPALERAVAELGLAPQLGRDAALVPRADGSGEVPWTLGLHSKDLRFPIERVRTACLIVVALLTGMRGSELMEIPLDACVVQDLGSGRVRYKLRTKLIKGQEQGGVWDEWVTVVRAHRAVELAAALVDPDDAAGLVFGRFHSDTRTKTLREWVNDSEGRRLGLAPIPDDPINIRITRRTLAMELAHRPGGLLAAKIHLKHLSVVTTEGYAALPGGAQAAFLADVAAEEQEANKNLTLAAFRDSQNGIMPSGPGARDLIEFFASVDAKLKQMELAAPGVKPGDQEVINLLARQAKTLHLGIANYCWFKDPAKALCLILAGKTGADKPMAGMCDSARCPQATHHPCHRPVWADSAQSKKIFIGKIGRGQSAEKARLNADMERDLRVLAEIDTAAGTRA